MSAHPMATTMPAVPMSARPLHEFSSRQRPSSLPMMASMATNATLPTTVATVAGFRRRLTGSGYGRAGLLATPGDAEVPT